MLHAKKGPWFSCKKQGETVLKKKKNPQTNETKQKKPNKQSDKNHKCTTNYSSVPTLLATFNMILRVQDWPYVQVPFSRKTEWKDKVSIF